MLLAPLHERDDGGHQRDARVGEGIFHARWHFGIHLPVYQVALLQVFQGLGKHLLGTVRHQVSQFIEAQHARLACVEHKEHQHRPLVAKATYHLPYGTVQITCLNICHNGAKVTKSYRPAKKTKLSDVKAAEGNPAVCAIPTFW